MSISLQILLWLLCFALQFALLTITFHQLLCIADLESDYVSPFEATVIINKWVMVEYVLQALLSLYLLLSWHWFMFLLTLPVTCYHAMLFMRRQHLIDVTEVFRNLKFEKIFRLVKLGFYILFFAISIIRNLGVAIFVWVPLLSSGLIQRIIWLAFNLIANDDFYVEII